MEKEDGILIGFIVLIILQVITIVMLREAFKWLMFV